MTKVEPSERRDSVTCPYCGLFCDDLSIAVGGARIEVTRNGCPIADDSFARIAKPEPPRIAGREASLEAACAKAGEILAAARQPLVAGLACDLAGAKAAISLAERLGAIVDHATSEAMFRNTLALQDKGWMTTTFAEVKNRADLVILAGTDVVSRFPRFFERLIWTKESLFGAPPLREIVYLGTGLDTKAGVAPDGRKPQTIACDSARIGEVFRALRALYRGWPLQAESVGGASVSELAALVARIKAARYGLVVWSAADMEFAQADLQVEAICDLVSEINENSRFSCLPLGGNENGLGAAQVCTWQEGFPLRTSFASGRPDYDPHLYAWRRVIDSGEADAVLWVSSFRAVEIPLGAALPQIVVAAPGTTFQREPAVFIPVGAPGVDHAGHVIRSDAVASLPLHKLRESPLPRTADVLRTIEARAQAHRKSA